MEGFFIGTFYAWFLERWIRWSYFICEPPASSSLHVWRRPEAWKIQTKEEICNLEPVPLRTVTELTLRKPTNLRKVEMTRGVEHVSKVPKEVKCKSLRGKVIYIHVQIIMRSQNYNLASKILDTKCNHKYVEKQNAYLSSWLLIWEIFLKQWAKDIISDSLSGTGDPLNLVIGIRVLTSGTFISVGLFFAHFVGETSKGDGVIVVPSIIRREGSQETVFNKDRTSIGKTIHSTHRPYGVFSL